MSPYCRCLNHKIPGPHEVGCPLFVKESSGPGEERVERIRELWGTVDPAHHRAPQLIRDVQFLLARLRAVGTVTTPGEERVEAIRAAYCDDPEVRNVYGPVLEDVEFLLDHIATLLASLRAVEEERDVRDRAIARRDERVIELSADYDKLRTELAQAEQRVAELQIRIDRADGALADAATVQTGNLERGIRQLANERDGLDSAYRENLTLRTQIAVAEQRVAALEEESKARDRAVAASIWESVIGLINAGTPTDGIRFLARSNIAALTSPAEPSA